MFESPNSRYDRLGIEETNPSRPLKVYLLL